jgi:hypothetical protein
VGIFCKYHDAKRISGKKTPFDSEQREKYAEYRGRSKASPASSLKFAWFHAARLLVREPDGKKPCVLPAA